MSRQNVALAAVDSELSKELEQLIIEELQPQLAQTFGYNALLYSSLAKSVCGNALCIKSQVVIGGEGEGLSLKCHFEELPIASDTIDLALLPLILQQSRNPHQILREVERVLIPEGVVVLIGRNPYSWRGLHQKFKHFRNKSAWNKEAPDKQKTVSINDLSRNRVEDWLRLLGLEVEKEMNVDLANARLQKSNGFQWVKKISSTFCEYFSSYYVIVARKKVSTLTPIRASWRRNKQLVPSRLAEPSIKAQVDSWIKQFK